MPPDKSDLVKVHFDLAEPDMGIGGESLWAAPVGMNLYELRNSPWHVRSVNWLWMLLRQSLGTRMSGPSLSEFTRGVATGPFTSISSMQERPARKRFWTNATDSVPPTRAWTIGCMLSISNRESTSRRQSNISNR
jgi:hypothetical protein